jgi:hypothetical protein
VGTEPNQVYREGDEEEVDEEDIDSNEMEDAQEFSGKFLRWRLEMSFIFLVDESDDNLLNDDSDVNESNEEMEDASE